MVASLFLVFHLTAITVANVSRNTALGTVLHRPFELYVSLLRLDQTWDMFTTIPHFRAMRGALVAIDAEGRETAYGPMIPGLGPYPDDPRVHSMFMRLAFVGDAFPGYSERYLVAVCRAISAKTSLTPAKVAFDLHTEPLRPLDKVRVDGRIADSNVSRYGPVACPR